MIRDIKPQSPVARLDRNLPPEDLAQPIETDLVAAVLGMNRSFLARALGLKTGARPKTVSIAEVLSLLDVDGYEETFVPRSKVPAYLLQRARTAADSTSAIVLPSDPNTAILKAGNARDLVQGLPPQSVQCVVTSSPYWGMRVYDNVRDLTWADGERCPYGFEQTPEGFIRHTVEILFLLKPALKEDASVWWNLMDTYNTRTPIRGSSKEKLQAMGGHPDHALGWTDHEACRHSAGHLYLADGELASIPSRIAERASRIGYALKSFVTWNKRSTPEPVQSRVTRQAEYILHLSLAGKTPYFDRDALHGVAAQFGGRNPTYESERLTDVWSFPTAGGKNGHGAEFPSALPGRCIALTSRPGDLVVDPFVGSGTSAIAAFEHERRFVGFDISDTYIELASQRLEKHTARVSSAPRLDLAEAGPLVLNGSAELVKSVKPAKAKPKARRRT